MTTLGTAERVTQISAPAGSGKTVLLRSWIADAGLADHAAWVAVDGRGHDPQRFWISVLDALRDTTAGSKLVRPLTAAPGLDGSAIVERLLEDLDPLEDRLWLVIDDLHELSSTGALPQLELLMRRAPRELRFVLSTRYDLRLGLHRLRLEGELTEIRAADLRFSMAEARALLEEAGVMLSGAALALLHERTEGWAAGLRLAALAAAGHPDPERFAAEFSGAERTVAEYLLAEVLERQSEQVRRLLLRTSVLDRVNGELADLLAGSPDGERVLHEQEQAGAFVVALDAARSWFRYHPMFGDLLQLELRRTEPERIPLLHDAAARWHAEHGSPVEAVQHAQAAANWDLAARLLSDHWLDLILAGQSATAHQLLTRFPADIAAANAETGALMAASEAARGSLAEAGQRLAQAAKGMVSVPADRRGRFQVTLAVQGLRLARKRGDLPAIREAVDRLLVFTEDLDTARLVLSEDLRAVALINLGIGEFWADQPADAERHLEQGIAVAREAGRPYLEIEGLAYAAMVARLHSGPLAAERATRAIELAGRHGWNQEPVITFAYMTLGLIQSSQGQLAEAARWLDHAERAIRPDAWPATAMTLLSTRGTFELARGRNADALAAFRTAERLAEPIVPQHTAVTWARVGLARALLRLGETGQAEAALDALDGRQRESADARLALAALRLAQGDPLAASGALAPVLDGSVPTGNTHSGPVQAFLLEAIARDAAGETAAARDTLERALDLAESGGMLLPFLLHPAPSLLERHRQSHTAHSSLISQILSLFPKVHEGTGSPPVGGPGEAVSPEEKARIVPLQAMEPLTDGEVRVLRYLPTHLTAHEIASQLHLSVHTVTTHMRHVYTKLGVHRRREAVSRAYDLGLLTLQASSRSS